ncbi:solute carrier family 15 member 5 isoform X2 [Oryzias melastigma]|uniref:solute carrier family 15 member 5 isoform X2 n=1 Tax=Oryzias melastigma TaxID=30732 RepID=UPI00168D8D63|nr:solute carrier family 15 member 5 isoform X2 [Oryzias melastigma]
MQRVTLSHRHATFGVFASTAGSACLLKTLMHSGSGLCSLRITAAGSLIQLDAPQPPPGSPPAMAAGELLLKGRSRRVSQSLPPERRSQRKPGKKLQVIICVLVVELCERFTFFGIVCNMILFCTVKLGYNNHLAATVNLCFIGASTLTPVLVGWFAETVLGRTKVLYLCALLHFFGTVMLPVVAFPFEDFYIDTHHMVHRLAPHDQQILFYTGLLAAALGIGGIRAVLCPMGAYSLQTYDQHQLLSFFNWFYWLVNLNSTVVFLGIAYIQQSVAQNLGFLIPFTSVLLTLIAIHMTRSKLTFKPRKGGSLLTTLGVFLNSLKMCCLHRRHLSGEVVSWLDRAKENNGGRYSEIHVENVKVLAKLFPLYGLQLLYRACVTQIPSGFYIQAMNSNLHLDVLLLPIGAMNVISILPLLLLAPLVELVTTCFISTGKSPLAPHKLITLGHACAVLSVLGAGVSEMWRRLYPLVEQTLSGKVLQVSSMPCFHLAPQYVLLGVAEALVTPASDSEPHQRNLSAFPHSVLRRGLFSWSIHPPVGARHLRRLLPKFTSRWESGGVLLHPGHSDGREYPAVLESVMQVRGPERARRGRDLQSFD